MSAAETLRQAADLIEQIAANTPAGPWRDVQDGWCIRSEPSPDRTSWRTVCDGPNPFARRWITTMGPQVAGPLAAWLRAEAESDDNPMCVVVEGATPPLVARVPAMATPYALAMARAILGEPT
jgi:hypothetical protein